MKPEPGKFGIDWTIVLIVFLVGAGGWLFAEHVWPGQKTGYQPVYNKAFFDGWDAGRANDEDDDGWALAACYRSLRGTANGDDRRPYDCLLETGRYPFDCYGFKDCFDGTIDDPEPVDDRP